MPEIISSIPYAGTYVTIDTTQQLNTTADDVIYVSIPNFPNFALINRLQITAIEDGISGAVDIQIMSDAAGYRAATTDHDKQDFVYIAYNDETGNGAPFTTWELDETYSSAIYYKDDTFSNTLHLSLTNVSLTGATAFTIRVWADQLPSDKGYSGRLQSFREAYILYDYETLAFIDYTLAMRNPWHQTLNAIQIFSDIDSNDEYLYIGAMRPFYKIYCSVAVPTNDAADVNLVAEYLDITGTWSTLTVADNTDVAMISGGGAINLPFSYSAAIYWSNPGDWDKRVLPDINSTAPPDGDAPRYWIRLALDAAPATWPTFYSIRQQSATGA